MSALPADHACPHCGAEAGQGCHSRSHRGSWGATTHAARWKLAGIERPTAEDRHRDYEDLKRRRTERAAQIYAEAARMALGGPDRSR